MANAKYVAKLVGQDDTSYISILNSSSNILYQTTINAIIKKGGNKQIWYSGTYSCGRKGRVNAIGKTNEV